MNGVGLEKGALNGVRVVDFGQYLSAPMVAMFLADNGADVIHIDPPEGPRWDHPANAALYRNKRSITLDLKTDAGRDEARRLMETADIVLENFRPGVMDRLGLGADSVSQTNPRLIWCAMPGFASDDPRAGLPAWEGVVCSAAGLYPTPNFRDGDPVFTALPLASNYGAFVASHRIAAALLSRSANDRGQILEVSLFEACFQGIGFYAEMPASRDFVGTLLGRVYPVMKMRKAADGNYIYFDSPLRGLQALLDRYLPNRKLLKMNAEALAQTSQELDDLILTKSGVEWERICQQEIKGAFGLVQSLPDWLADQHARDSETVVEVDDVEFGPTVQAGYPVLLSLSKPSVRWGRGKHDPAPGVQIDWLEPQRIADAAPTSDLMGLPLDGLRVLDCSSLLAGPTTARVLAQYGAEVIKIDRVEIANGEFDPLSDDEVAFIGARTVSAGKRMMFLDLKSAKGQEILHKMVETADVVHHNFTPPAAQKLGLASTTLREINAPVIVSTMSLHSHGGFRAEYRGHDMLGQMITGMGHRAGGNGDPQVASTYLNDNASGHLHAFGIMLALLHRNRTGQGQDVNSALSRTATLHQVPFMVGFEGRVWDEPTGPDARGWHPLNRLYQATDGWFFLSADVQDGKRSLEACSLFDGENLPDGEALAQTLEAKFATIPSQTCVAALNEAGVSAQIHRSLVELAGDAYVAQHGLLTAVEHPGIGCALGIGLLTYGADNQPATVLAARRPGMDTLDLLQEYGFEPRIGEFLRDKVVAIGEAVVLNTPQAKDYWGKIDLGQPSLLGGLEPTPEALKILNTSQPFPTVAVSKYR
jgi:crotonobetainyl-CoA:carnitine CoA-transferase CaiB-like acyl-CoA transferase